MLDFDKNNKRQDNDTVHVAYSSRLKLRESNFLQWEREKLPCKLSTVTKSTKKLFMFPYNNVTSFILSALHLLPFLIT